MEHYSFKLYHNLLAGFELGGGGTTRPAVATAVTALPAKIPNGTALTFLLTLYADQPKGEAHDMTGATAMKMYAQPAGSLAARTEIGGGVLTGCTPADGESVWTVAKDELLDAWSTYDGVRIWIEIEDADSDIPLYQDIAIVSRSGLDTDTDWPEASEIAPTYVDAAADASLTAKPGLQIARVDCSAAKVTLALPDPADEAAGPFLILIESAGSGAAVDPGAYSINGSTDDLELSGLGDAVELWPAADGSEWVLIGRNLSR